MDQITKSEADLARQALENLRKRLLDLTARNKLINFSFTKGRSLRVIDELPNQLVETLLNGKEMRFAAVPEPTEKELIEAGYLEFDADAQKLIRLRDDPKAEAWAKHLGISTSYEVPESSDDSDDRHSDDAIQTLFYAPEMEARLKSLLSTGESAVQEMGANILYLAFGFLEWFESDTSDKARWAPLFLLPIQLKKGRLNTDTGTYEYSVSYSGEDLIPNLSLKEKLKADFGFALPELYEDTAPEEYFERVQSLVQNKRRWRVRRFVSVALLNFSKLLMYLDLDPERWPEGSSILDHPIVSGFLAGYGNESDSDEGSEAETGFGEEYALDELDDIHGQYPLIDDADSSQHSALIDVLDGKNLVIEGPPGTGKSQTITNLIAAAMAQGKKVLFVAEKLAALEVVRRRLDDAGLGEFCLELHSHKSQKRKVLDEVEARLKKHGRYKAPREIDADIDRYEELKSELMAHAQKVNKPWANTGKTAHEILVAATRYRMEAGVSPERFHPQGYNGDNYDPASQRRLEDQLATYANVSHAIAAQISEEATLHSHPWYGLWNSELQMFDEQRVMGSLNAWQSALTGLAGERQQAASRLGCEISDISDSVDGLNAFTETLENRPALHGNELLDSVPKLHGDTLEKTKKYLKLFENIQGIYGSLAEQVGAQALEDLSSVALWVTAKEQLRDLVDPGMSLAAVADSSKLLEERKAQLDTLVEPVTELAKALGDSATGVLSVSESGLREFKTLSDAIVSLDASLWKYRADIFDNDELDRLLPQMRDEIEALLNLQEQVGPAYALENLPSEKEVRDCSAVVAAGGAFRWFSGEWRKAKKHLLSLSAGPHVKLPTLLASANAMAAYCEGLRKLESNREYQIALQGHWDGLNTDLKANEDLRAWYRQVRAIYGIGFGPKVALGEALIQLPTEVARAIRALSARGDLSQIDGILADISQFRKVFSPVEAIQSQSVELTGDEGVLTQLMADLNQAVQGCGVFTSDKSITVAEMLRRIEKIELLKQLVETWKRADYDNRLFQGRLGLKVGVGVDNSSGVSALENTLNICEWIEHQSENTPLVEFLRRDTSNETFDVLEQLKDAMRILLDEEKSCFDSFSSLVSLELESWLQSPETVIQALIDRNQIALENPQTLSNWLEYVRVREQSDALGLSPITEEVEDRNLEIDNIANAYRAGVYDMLSRELLAEDRSLARFSGLGQEAIQKQFKSYDEELKGLQQQHIAWKIDQNKIPRGNAAARVSDRTGRVLLEHECAKKTRHLPIRQLILRAGDALISAKPCFMMGPMSVAQFLAPENFHFDLVVMDEASQIKPQDALGAIARGTQVVVVGDPKQLPPTSFFDRVVDDENDDSQTGIEESESILDATRNMFYARRLRWHYRSQHENLIAFSNRFFYDGDLVLFPSPYKDSEEFGVQYTRVSRGCFVNRRNLEEARVIAEHVRKHYLSGTNESLGVVAMNAEQRLQIESAIETLAKDDPTFQKALEEDAITHEPLFVKNLENVQGDEREIIVISMTYGPQEPGGRVPQRFGPINSDTGWRRLNVLFTRSKKRMQVFSSMGSSDIVVEPGSRRGIRALRDFLAYCETGVLHKTDHFSDRGAENDFEISVMQALREEGFECVPQVGVEGYFIDAGVLDPGNPGNYLMGIECDGATYHSAKSTRDRDRLRQDVLERLGWKIRRIWSTDWFKNPQGVLRPIIDELNQLKTEPVAVVEVELEDREEIAVAEAADTHTELAERDGESLADKLSRFNAEIIEKAFPDTPEKKRLLRPAMIEALVEYSPTSRAEFLEYLPHYIRSGTEPAEAKFLDQIFEIINNSACYDEAQ